MSQQNVGETSIIGSVYPTNAAYSLPLDQCFGMIDDNHYYQTVQRDVKFQKQKEITIESLSVCSSIELLDVPIADYILSLNGHNIMTSTGKFVINNVSSESGKNFLQCGANFYGTGDYFKTAPPPSLNAPEYVNLTRYDHCRVNYPSSINIPRILTVALTGHHYDCNTGEWFYGIKNIVVYPFDTFSLDARFVTDSLDFKLQLNTNSKVIILIDGNIYQCIDNPPSKFRVRMLPNNVNEAPKIKGRNETLNLDRCCISVVALNCNIYNITQQCLKEYHWPTHICTSL